MTTISPTPALIEASREELAAIRRGRAQIRRGEFVSLNRTS
jgi:hypothetical protein